MPELPEVETIKRRLEEVLLHKKIAAVDIVHHKIFHGDRQQLVGKTITAVSRRSKILRIHLPTDLNILIHLKMTGQLIYLNGDGRIGGGHPTADFFKDLPSAHTRVIVTLDDGSKLFFNDQRLFGWLKVATDQEVEREFSTLGPDIIDERVTVEYLVDALSRRSIPIKQALMTNQIVAGVGNIYASDSLNVAQISPFRPANSLTQREVERLLVATKAVINEGIEYGGTTFDGKYVDIHGLTGSYQDRIKAYGRADQECYQCGGTIIKTTLGGRGTYYCGRCQN